MSDPFSPPDVFKCLADATRIRLILLILREGELCVCELIHALDDSQPKISRHLAQLRSCALLVDRRQGQWIYYRLNPQLPQWVSTVLETTLQANQAWLQSDAQRLAAMGLGVGWSASIGAILALACGVISLADIPVVWQIIWNATGTFVALIIISLILDEAGFFAWAALHVARWGRGRGRRLFAYMVLLGALVSALFANDGAALILTPIVMSMLLALRFSPAATLAFVMGAGFIADTASLPLVVSNLVNIVSADYFNIGFNQYAAVMVPVNLVSVAATLAVLLWFFRRDIPHSYDPADLPEPASAIHDPATFHAAWWVLGILLVGCFALEPLGIPISAISAACALLLLVIAAKGHKISTRKVLKEAPWQIVIFSLGLYLVVYDLRNAGLTTYLATWLNTFADYGVWGAALGTGLLTALLSSVMNNLPTVLIGALSIE
eukprot:gene18791-18662_t